MIELTTHTERKVAGKKTMVKSAIDFITVLSWWARLLKACTCQLSCELLYATDSSILD